MPDVRIGSVPAYLAVPAGSSAPWPGAVVMHESWGLNRDIRAHADRLAAGGCVALAPDLYHGKSWMRCIIGVIRQLRAGSGPAFDAVEAARAWLAARADCTGRVGVIGFCLGGGFALLCAPRGEFSAAAVNYGQVPADADRLLAGSCPIVGSYGARDMMGTGPPRRLEEALTALNVPHDVKVYPDAGHSFMSPKPASLAPLVRLSRLEFSPESAQDAWRRIFAFFGEHLAAEHVADEHLAVGEPAAERAAGEHPAAGDPAAGDPAAGDPAAGLTSVQRACSLEQSSHLNHWFRSVAFPTGQHSRSAGKAGINQSRRFSGGQARRGRNGPLWALRP